jgi:hypothetical protein
MSAILNAAPQANLQGIRDTTSTASQSATETLPQFLPHVFFFAQKGQLTPTMADGDTFDTLYGAGTLDPSQPFYQHPNALIENVFANAGTIMAQRLVPNDAPPPATVLVSLDILATNVSVTTGEGSGAHTDSVPGYIAKFVVGDVPDGILGAQTVGVGSQQASGGGAQSQLVPLFEFQVSSQGSDGNNQGFAISAPTTVSAIPADTTASSTIDAFIFNFRQVSRTSSAVTGLTVGTLSGDQTVPFCLNPNALYVATNTQYGMEQAILNAYQALGNPGVSPIYGNFGAMHVYQANIDTVLAEIFAAELSAGGTGLANTGTPTNDKYQVNLFGATDVDGNPYLTYSLLGAGQGGTIFSDNTTIYASGGADGTITAANLDALVQQQLLGYGTSIYNFTDMALWPQSWFIDSGFTISTKEAAGTLLGVRKDIGVIVATQDVSLPQNSSAEDSSTAIALSASLSQWTESAVYGTPVCRAAVIGQSGNLISSTYTGLLPLSIDLAGKMAAYMGATNGNWVTGKAFNVTPLNKCTIFKNVNATSKTSTAYSADWTNNLIWAQNYDRSSIFYPAFQTVYDDDTSVLNSLMTVAACIELEKVCFRTWRDLTGRDDLTQDQLIKQSNKLITAQVPAAKFDGKYTVVPDTYFSAADTARNYSWSTDITLYANPMYTVGTFTITAANMSDLTSSSTAS